LNDTNAIISITGRENKHSQGRRFGAQDPAAKRAKKSNNETVISDRKSRIHKESVLEKGCPQQCLTLERSGQYSLRRAGLYSAVRPLLLFVIRWTVSHSGSWHDGGTFTD
jgi:hypothetical protein